MPAGLTKDREARLAARDAARAYDDVVEQVVQGEEEARVRAAMGELTDLQREAVSLAYWGGLTSPQIAARLKRTGDGLVAAIAQDATSGAVLMLAWMNDDALARTLATREATYWSRSRQELWVKGATSGHTQHVRSVALDCDGDALLVRVDQVGAACHTGEHTCFDAGDLGAVVGERA